MDGCLLGKEGVQGVGDESEEHATTVDVFGQFSQHCAEEEHHVVEWVESVPEGRADENDHIVFEARLLSSNESSIVDVVLQPQVDHVVPVLFRS